MRELLPVPRSVNIEQSLMLIRPDKLLAAMAARVVGFAGHAETLPSHRLLACSVSIKNSIMNRCTNYYYYYYYYYYY